MLHVTDGIHLWAVAGVSLRKCRTVTPSSSGGASEAAKASM
ncbi:MAG: hypothetical protein ACLPX7_11390 [Xanthobacteraceae bacterium]